MCLSFGEIPDIAYLKIFNLIFSIFIDGEGADRAIRDNGPFGLPMRVSNTSTVTLRTSTAVNINTDHRMPMQLAVRSFGQVHLRGRQIGTGGKIGDDLFPNPAAWEDSCSRVGEAPFQVRYRAMVGRLGAEIVGVGPIDLIVGSAWSTIRIEAQREGRGLTRNDGTLALPINWLAFVELLAFSQPIA